jgi:signal peptidase II
MNEKTRLKLLPLILTGVVIAVDQAVKAIIAAALPLDRRVDVLGDFFRITHRRNPFIVFSMGSDLPPLFQTLLFLVLPIFALGLLVFFYFKEKDLHQAYRLPLAAIMGGGVGNLLDRVLRPEGVVDFLDFKFFGLFGMERFPTFNCADMGITIGVAATLVIALLHEIRKRRAASSAGGDVK